MIYPHAKKRLGQNFLTDESVAERIVRALGPRPDETVVEIGAGRGALTGRLIERVGRLVAIEFDRELIPLLEGRFGGRENFELIKADALSVDFCEAIKPAVRARVVANLPYNISTAILQKLIRARRCLTDFVLMLQREVVERITAEAGSSERGYLSVLVEAYCETERLFDVAPGAFRPVPKVVSTVVRVRVKAASPVDGIDEELFLRLVGYGFAQRRKTIQNNLRAAPDEFRQQIDAAGGAEAILSTAQIEQRRRAETLTLDEWVRLSQAIENSVRQ